MPIKAARRTCLPRSEGASGIPSPKSSKTATGAWTDPKPEWRTRKEAYLKKLRSMPAQSGIGRRVFEKEAARSAG
jgi:hypothetical protein